jgi:hypothetical protein
MPRARAHLLAVMGSREQIGNNQRTVPTLSATHLDAASGRKRHKKLWVSGGLACAIVIFGAGWAATTIFVPSKSPLATESHVFARVIEGSIEDFVPLRVTAEWTAEPSGRNQAVGTVTRADLAPASIVEPGAIIYSVNLRPTVVAQGEVPAFRPLGLGTIGDDVKQLQELLAKLKFYAGQPDGVFGPRTDSAVKRWQVNNGVDNDGLVQTGDVIYLPVMPLRIELNIESIARGAAVSGGEEAVRSLAASPSFTAVVTPAQSGAISEGTAVTINTVDGYWNAEVAGKTSNDDGSLTLTLRGVDRQPICDIDCHTVATGSPTSMQARAITSPKQSGLVVPVGAIRTTADGKHSVIDDTGRSLPIKLIASAQGQSIITGLKIGTRVRLGVEDQG